MRTVFCQKYQQELEGLSSPPYPGEEGLKIYQNISAKAWDAWLAHQKRLINEKHLALHERGTREYLREQMKLFFRNEAVEEASGYTPTSSDDEHNSNTPS